MCGRYTLTRPDLPPPVETDGAQAPLFNIAPSQRVPIVRAEADRLLAAPAVWGFTPDWWDGEKKIPHPINARLETAAHNGLFRQAWRRGRCLLPADGWYEWQAAEGGAKQPHRITLPDGGLFWFAGLCAGRAPDDRSFAILTTAAQPAIMWLHARMPCALPLDAGTAWLEGALDADTLPGAMIGDWRAYPVSRAVNNPRNRSPELVDPL